MPGQKAGLNRNISLALRDTQKARSDAADALKSLSQAEQNLKAQQAGLRNAIVKDLEIGILRVLEPLLHASPLIDNNQVDAISAALLPQLRSSTHRIADNLIAAAKLGS